MIECLGCNHWYHGITFRWRCPECGFKLNCCDKGVPCNTEM